KRFHDLADYLRKGQTFPIFGASPEIGAELYLGFSQPWPQNQPVSLFLTFAGPRKDEQERARIIEEAKSRRRACNPPPHVCRDKGGSPGHSEAEPNLAKLPARARVEWEAWVEVGGAKTWLPLDPQKHQVDDDTH